jgi:hypothetical protein
MPDCGAFPPIRALNLPTTQSGYSRNLLTIAICALYVNFWGHFLIVDDLVAQRERQSMAPFYGLVRGLVCHARLFE